MQQGRFRASGMVTHHHHTPSTLLSLILDYRTGGSFLASRRGSLFPSAEAVEQGRGVGMAHVPSLRDSRAFSHADPALTCWATIVTPCGLCLEPAQILKNGDLS